MTSHFLQEDGAQAELIKVTAYDYFRHVFFGADVVPARDFPVILPFEKSKLPSLISPWRNAVFNYILPYHSVVIFPSI